MIDITEGIAKSLRTKKGLDYLTLDRIESKTEETLTGIYDIKQKRNPYGIYTGADTKIKQQELLNSSKKYYTDFINRASFEGGDLRDGNENFRKINDAIVRNKKLVGTMINGEYTVQIDEKSQYLSYEQIKILNPKAPPPQGVNTGKTITDTTVQVGELKSSQEYVSELKELKNRYPDLAQSRINNVEKNFVKSYMEENNLSGTEGMSEAQKVFRQLTQG